MPSVNYSPSQFAYAYGTPPVTGVIRSCPEDFQVDEILGFSADGQGEHFLLQIRKRNTNTEWLARQLATFAGVKSMDVSYAGLKDRNAITTQWFTVRIPGLHEPDWQQFNSEDYQVIAAARHGRKLRRGTLQGNHFRLAIRDIEGDLELLVQRLELLKAQGVPNYFGEQRFGIDGNNLEMAQMMFAEGKKIKNRQKRSLYISAARSYLFNLVCSARVEKGNWNRAIAGEALMLSGSHSFFVAESIDDVIRQRLLERDVVPTGPLWGRGSLSTIADARCLEESIMVGHEQWCEGLEKQGLKQERRPLVIYINDLQWQFADQQLVLEFTLPPGSYATSVLREVVSY